MEGTITQDKEIIYYYKKVKQAFNQDYVIDFFDRDKINKLLEEHFENKKNNGRKIYNIYTFLIWYQVYFIDWKET